MKTPLTLALLVALAALPASVEAAGPIRPCSDLVSRDCEGDLCIDQDLIPMVRQCHDSALLACIENGGCLAAQAEKPYCIEGEPGCPSGMLVCWYSNPMICVVDPCATTACWRADVRALP